MLSIPSNELEPRRRGPCSRMLQAFGDHDSIETSLQPSCRRKGFSHDAPVIAILGTSKIPLNNMEQSGERPHNC